MNEGSGEPEKSAELQFDKVELATPSASRTCPGCQRLIGDEYYEVSGNAICSACAASLGQSAGGMSLLRGFVFGAGAALVSSIAWYAFGKITKWELGIIAIAVGFFVGYAVRRGARSTGGWRYQALAMVLTYFAIAGSQVPYVVDGLRQTQMDLALSPGAWAFVFGIALASPFFGGVQSIMGLVILGIALYEAWKLNRRVPVSGPFRLGSALPTS